MTEQELSRYYWLQKEIKDLEERIAIFDCGVSAVKYKELNVDSTPQYHSIQESIAILKDKWMDKRVSALEEYIKIENFISSIEDIDLRLIFRYRFLDCMNWDDIGIKVGYDRTSVSKKVRNYLNKNSIV